MMRKVKIEVKGNARVSLDGSLRAIDLETGEVLAQLEINPEDIVEVKVNASEMADFDKIDGVKITIPIAIEVGGLNDGE